MPLYAFKVHDICRIVDSFTLKDALQEAFIKNDDEYELIGEEDLEYMCSLSTGENTNIPDLPGV